MENMRKLDGKFHKTAEGNVTYDIYHAEAEHIFPVATLIQKKFGFLPKQLPVMGLDSIFLELFRREIKIMVGWDNWSGLFVMAVDEKGNAAVREIGEYLRTQEIRD